MPKEQGSTGRRLYRRVNQWRNGQTRILPDDTAFHLREGEDGVSFADASAVTPRSLLEQLIENWQKLAADDSSPQKAWAQRKITRCGGSVEGVTSQDWGVVEIAESALIDCGFEADKTEPGGHVLVRGTKSQFEEQGPAIVEACRTLALEECLH